MPTYQYQCTQCGYELEELQSMTEQPLRRCPGCNTDNLARILGTGGGLIFKGTGFYLTDYKKESAKPDTHDKSKDEPKKKDDKPAETKTPETKTPETKPSSEKKSPPKKNEDT